MKHGKTGYEYYGCRCAVCKSARNKYYREWKRAAYPSRVARIHEYLGGHCVVCQSTEQLNVDHIDPTTKHHNPLQWLFVSWEKQLPELDKCQLLCYEHHVTKHRSSMADCMRSNQKHRWDIAESRIEQGKRAAHARKFRWQKQVA